jgi:hypothetical protein
MASPRKCVVPLSCPICMDALCSGVVAAACGHLYHKECLAPVLAGGAPKCPQCRAPLSRRDVVALVLDMEPAGEAEARRAAEALREARLAELAERLGAEGGAGSGGMVDASGLAALLKQAKRDKRELKEVAAELEGARGRAEAWSVEVAGLREQCTGLRHRLARAEERRAHAEDKAAEWHAKLEEAGAAAARWRRERDELAEVEAILRFRRDGEYEALRAAVRARGCAYEGEAATLCRALEERWRERLLPLSSRPRCSRWGCWLCC